MSSDPEDFEDYEEPPEESFEGILTRMLIREFRANEILIRKLNEIREKTDGL